MSEKTKVVVLGRRSYENIWESKSINGSDPKYSVSIIFLELFMIVIVV